MHGYTDESIVIDTAITSGIAASDAEAGVARFHQVLADVMEAGRDELAHVQPPYPGVEKAVRTVPREASVPDGTDLPTAYANNIVFTKRDATGRTISSISAHWLSLSTLIVLRSLRAGERVPPISESLIATSGDCCLTTRIS